MRGFFVPVSHSCGPTTTLNVNSLLASSGHVRYLLREEWLVRSGMSKRPLCPRPDQPPYGAQELRRT